MNYCFHQVRCDRKMALFMLGVWSYSLMQFTLVSTGGNYDDDDGLSLLRKFAERQKVGLVSIAKCAS